VVSVCVVEVPLASRGARVLARVVCAYMPTPGSAPTLGLACDPTQRNRGADTRERRAPLQSWPA